MNLLFWFLLLLQHWNCEVVMCEAMSIEFYQSISSFMYNGCTQTCCCFHYGAVYKWGDPWRNHRCFELPGSNMVLFNDSKEVLLEFHCMVCPTPCSETNLFNLSGMCVISRYTCKAYYYTNSVLVFTTKINLSGTIFMTGNLISIGICAAESSTNKTYIFIFYSFSPLYN